MIGVGENTGRLDRTLLQLAGYYEQEVGDSKANQDRDALSTFVIQLYFDRDVHT